MCGGFLGKIARELDFTGTVEKNGLYERKKRQAEEAITAQKQEAEASLIAEEDQKDKAEQETSKASLLARRRRRASSLFADGSMESMGGAAPKAATLGGA